jgi:hypothetical protein
MTPPVATRLRFVLCPPRSTQYAAVQGPFLAFPFEGTFAFIARPSRAPQSCPSLAVDSAQSGCQSRIQLDASEDPNLVTR